MKIKWNFLILAFCAVISIMGIGVAIGERSLIGIFACILLLCGIMGYGFMQKKKIRERGEL